MLERLEIINFQNHTRTRIRFDPKITTIVGPNDAGKSATLRAIRWLALNKPNGTDFIRHDTDDCSVRLWLDSYIVQRYRSKASNHYMVGAAVYKAMGAGVVPDPVAKILNLGEVNFQGQLEPPFWFTESGPQISRNLNAIIDLGVIDDAMSYCANLQRRAALAHEVAADRLAKAEAALAATEHVEALNADLMALEGLAGAWSKARETADRVASTAAAVKDHEQRAAALGAAAAAGRAVLALGATAGRARATADSVAGLVADAKRPVPVVPDLRPLDALRAAAVGRRSEAAAIRSSIDQAKDEDRKRRDAVARLATAKETLNNYSGGICPICQKPLLS